MSTNISTIKRALNQKLSAENNRFKIKAYKNIILQLDKIDDNAEISVVDILKSKYNITGIGKSIQTVIEDIVSGKTVVVVDKRVEAINTFCNIMSVGIVKATALVDKHNIYTIDELNLPDNIKLLNDKQVMGLKYFDDFNQKIPRKEMAKHCDLISKFVKEIKTETGVDITYDIVGSYRRGSDKSGDIDILITNATRNVLEIFLNKLEKNKYLMDQFARGAQKYMGVCKVKADSMARRIDILYVIPEQYPFALLYFTGSKNFNIKIRKHALDKNYTLNEHGLQYKDDAKSGKYIETNALCEKDVFKFLDMEYVEPSER